MSIKPRKASGFRLKDGTLIRFPAVMGILNVTPDSFSDGGRFLDVSRAAARALAMEREGAAIIDVGGESTRPGAKEVPLVEELRRVIPVLRRLAGKLRCPLSIDTRKAEVARIALSEGAAIVNDVSALSFDRAMAGVVAESGAAVVLMHMRGGPERMMSLARYANVVVDVRRYLRNAARQALKAGIKPGRIILDPGIGFAKSARHNLEILDNLPRLCSLGYPVLVGISRKNFVRRIAGGAEHELLFGTAAAVALAIARGAAIVRVHDPGPMLAAVKMAVAMISASSKVGDDVLL